MRLLPLLLCLLASGACAARLPLEQLKLPTGYQIDIVARVSNARQMALAGQGVLFVGSRRAGVVTALRDQDGNGVYEQKYIIATGLNMRKRAINLI